MCKSRPQRQAMAGCSSDTASSGKGVIRSASNGSGAVTVNIVAEPLDVPGLIGTEGSAVFAFDRVALGHQLAYGASQVDDVLDGYGVRQQVVVLQPLLLLVRVNLQEQP